MKKLIFSTAMIAALTALPAYAEHDIDAKSLTDTDSQCYWYVIDQPATHRDESFIKCMAHHGYLIEASGPATQSSVVTAQSECYGQATKSQKGQHDSTFSQCMNGHGYRITRTQN